MTGAICLRNDDKAEVVQILKDGNPAFAGAMLYSKYQTVDRVKELIANGDILELHEKINPVKDESHYIVKKRGRKEKKCIQDHVCIFLGRDVISDDLSCEDEKMKAKSRTYNASLTFQLISVIEGVDYLYVFDANNEKWTTITVNDKEAKPIKVDYMFYAKNLLYRDDITNLSEIEKRKLKLLCCVNGK